MTQFSELISTDLQLETMTGQILFQVTGKQHPEMSQTADKGLPHHVNNTCEKIQNRSSESHEKHGAKDS